MYSVENFITDYRKEALICINLYGKIPEGGLDYRPTLGQRSTLELMRYLGFGPINGVRRIVAGDWSVGLPASESSKDMPASDFPARMAWQADEAERLVRSMTSMALDKESITFPWGETMTKGPALVSYPLKWITGYRMQLFLYLKAAGAHHLGTAEAWRHPV